ncbi:hypothetical protein SeMB42_g01243 [Synchytrium endobioticum]|uniref:Outer dynein arm-docking complex subunit 4 n=1 Tax=Synchytrium endobioticum TaxID=286115 RepID=A0A507DMM9_9FUNG|nr:hypothetical protein SeMB42_g01243 [Synchytrium endobioticum]
MRYLRALVLIEQRTRRHFAMGNTRQTQRPYVWDRDYNAAKNILYCFLHERALGERPPWFKSGTKNRVGLVTTPNSSSARDWSLKVSKSQHSICKRERELTASTSHATHPQSALSFTNTMSKSLNEDTPQHVGTYNSVIAEADRFARIGLYAEARDLYTKALLSRPSDKTSLVNRARCHNFLGESEKALEDADSALSTDPHFIKALYCKAEALYDMGEFELSLVQYHRGHRLKPELCEFMLGVHKATASISQAVAQLSEARAAQHVHHDCVSSSVPLQSTMRFMTPSGEHVLPYAEPKLHQRVLGATGRSRAVLSSDAEKTLLEELYEDKVFMMELANDPAFYGDEGSEVHKLLLGGLRFLDARVEFWSQKNPLVGAQNVNGLAVTGRRRNAGSRNKDLDQRRVKKDS